MFRSPTFLTFFRAFSEHGQTNHELLECSSRVGERWYNLMHNDFFVTWVETCWNHQLGYEVSLWPSLTPKDIQMKEADQLVTSWFIPLLRASWGSNISVSWFHVVCSMFFRSFSSILKPRNDWKTSGKVTLFHMGVAEKPSSHRSQSVVFGSSRAWGHPGRGGLDVAIEVSWVMNKPWLFRECGGIILPSCGFSWWCFSLDSCLGCADRNEQEQRMIIFPELNDEQMSKVGVLSTNHFFGGRGGGWGFQSRTVFFVQIYWIRSKLQLINIQHDRSVANPKVPQRRCDCVTVTCIPPCPFGGQL